MNYQLSKQATSHLKSLGACPRCGGKLYLDYDWDLYGDTITCLVCGHRNYRLSAKDIADRRRIAKLHAMALAEGGKRG